MYFKINRLLPIIISSFLVVSCDNNVGGTTNNDSNHVTQLEPVAKAFVKDFLDNHTKNTEITAMTLTMSCNANDSVTAISGVMGKHNDNPLPQNAVFRIGSITFFPG